MQETIVIKLGGLAAKKLTQDFISSLRNWRSAGKRLIIVHGGGYAIDALMEQRQLEVEKVDGLRVTSQAVLACVEQGLKEIVGPKLTASLNQAGLDALQINQGLGRIVTADYLNQPAYGYVGQVAEIQQHYLMQLLDEGLLPVIPSLGLTKEGQLLNINADDVAGHLAAALQAEQLVLMTDVPGVKEAGAVLPELTLTDVRTKIRGGVITGNMIPKVKGAAEAVLAGVGWVSIGESLQGGTRILKGI